MSSCTSCGVGCLGRGWRLPRTSRSMKRLERRSRQLQSRNFARDSQVYIVCVLCHSLLMIYLDEFNQYLSYVRNLGFEDTPDYDLLRDLFTQALKNTGEVEDGEYDWMKLNNGKGWEAISKHPASNQYHQGHNQAHATTAGELRHVPPAQVRQPPQGLTPGRLNAPHPPPPSPGKPMVQTRGDRQNATGAQPTKRPSAPTGGLPKPVSTPTASTQAQFQASNPTLQPTTRGQSPQALNTQQLQPRNSQTEPKKSFMQKLSSVFCCGTTWTLIF